MNIVSNIDKKFGKFSFYIDLTKIEEVVFLFAFIFNPLPIISYLVLLYFTVEFLLFIKILLTVIFGLSVTTILKRYFKRQRPDLLNNRKYNFRSVEKNFSMPSGDSLQAGLWSMILLLYFNFYYGILFVPLVMFARCYYQCHYLSDTIIGALLGMKISYLVYYVSTVI